MAKKKISKPVAKKKAVAPEKKSPVKVIQKKKATKAVPAKKVAAKKTVKKKIAIKKASPVSKKAPQKAVAKKKVTGKKVAPVKAVKSKPYKIPAKVTPPMPEVLTEKKEENNKTDMDRVLVTQDDPTIDTKPEDPLMSFDKHAFQKATTKGDPHSKLHLNTTGKSAIRPSGKKPLWKK